MERGWKTWEIDATSEEDLQGFEEHLVATKVFSRPSKPVAQPEQPAPVQLRPAEGDVGAVVLVTDDAGTGMMQGLPF